MSAEELIALDRIARNLRDLNQTVRDFMKLFEERSRHACSDCVADRAGKGQKRKGKTR